MAFMYIIFYEYYYLYIEQLITIFVPTTLSDEIM